MFKRRNATRMLVTMALLSAIEVVLARFIVPMPNPTMRFSIEAVPIIVAGYLYGPVAGAIVGLVGDAVGTLFSGYGYNPLFAVPPMLIPNGIRGRPCSASAAGSGIAAGGRAPRPPSLDEVYWPCSHSRAMPSFPSQLEWKIGLAWANTRGILNSPS